MDTTTFSKEVNLKINRFLAKTDFSLLKTENEITSLLGGYLSQSGYDVLQGFELRGLKSLYEHPFPSVEKIDLMVKSPLENEFFPIEVKYFRGITQTEQRRKDIENSCEAIQTMLRTYGICDGGRTICLTDNPYLSGEVSTAKQLNLEQKKKAVLGQVSSFKRRTSATTPKEIEWKKASDKSRIKYTSIKSEPIKVPKEDWIDNSDEVICSWHEQYKKRQNSEHVDF